MKRRKKSATPNLRSSKTPAGELETHYTEMKDGLRNIKHEAESTLGNARGFLARF